MNLCTGEVRVVHRLAIFFADSPCILRILGIDVVDGWMACTKGINRHLWGVVMSKAFYRQGETLRIQVVFWSVKILNMEQSVMFWLCLSSTAVHMPPYPCFFFL